MQIQNRVYLTQGFAFILGFVTVVYFLQLYHPKYNFCQIVTVRDCKAIVMHNKNETDKNVTNTSARYNLNVQRHGQSDRLMMLNDHHFQHRWHHCISTYSIPYRRKYDSEVPKSVIGYIKNFKATKKVIAPDFPRVIWMFWNTGWRNAPTMQYKCMLSWIYYNPDFNVVALDIQQAECLISRKKYYSDDAWKSASIQAKSDIIRIELLSRFPFLSILGLCR